MSKFWIEHPDIFNELNNVSKLIKYNTQETEKHFNESIGSMVDAGGKMLRPAFLLIAGKFGNYDEEKMQNLGAVIEMIHIASLVHDDIIDESQLRRGVESVQSKYGKEYAVYIGDYLFCQSFMMLAEYNYKPENLKNISKAMSRICLGEINQYNLRYNTDVNLKNYIKVVAGKTAALFAMSFYMGAMESQCDEKLSKNLARIGYNLGMAFQIKDDLLDYTSNSGDVGKDTQRDLVKGYYTLPLIFAMQKDRTNQIKNFIDAASMKSSDVNEVIDLVGQYGGTDKATKIMNRYTDKALKNIKKLPKGQWSDLLNKITVSLLDRSY